MEFQPTKDQAAALTTIQTWKNLTPLDDGYLFFGLYGYAGTGKTTVIQQKILQWLQEACRICMAAPTHKAVGVLANAAQQWGIGHVDHKTIHSLLSLQKTYTDDGEVVFRPDPKRDQPVADFDLVIVDECSMIGAELYSLILQAASDYGTRFVFMGDPAQLPPVKEEDEGSPTFDVQHSATLSEVVRYSGVLGSVVAGIRNSIGEPGYPPLPQETLTADNNGKVEYLESQDWLQGLLTSIAEEPVGTKALAWTNKSVDWINDWVRTQLYGEDCEAYEIGERMVAVETVTYKDMSGFEQVLMHTEDGCTIEKAEKSERLGLKCWKLTVKSDTSPTPQIVYAHDSKTERAWWNKQRELRKKAKKDRKLWRDYFEIKEGFAKLRAGYATTIHKSQGSTYSRVFLAQSDVIKCPDAELRDKLLYVAYSRASRDVLIYRAS